MTARVLVVQHSSIDPVGRLGDWLTEGECVLRVVECHHGEELPASLDGYAALVVLGGEMGANDDAEVSWLGQTKALLREAVERDLPTLAVCLGHQLLAVAAGGRVAQAPVPQQGLTPVGLTNAAAGDSLFAPLADAAAVHWNNDLVVSAPPGAEVLARSDAGIQAIRLGRNVYGVQFHPEVDVPTVASWADHDVTAGSLSVDGAAQRLSRVAAADPELVATWGHFGHRFAEQALGRAATSEPGGMISG